MKISYSLLVHNETDTLEKLLKFLTKWKQPDDEIVILDDFSDDEKKQGDEIINTFTNGEYGVLLISNRYNYEADNLIVDKLKQSS